MKHSVGLLLLGVVMGVLGIACREGSSSASCEIEPVALPPGLGIVDDDARWLCDARPEAPRRDPNLGRQVAGMDACLGGSGPPVPGGDLFVAPAGSDAATGESGATALATLQEALCRVRPGQTIHLAAGTYPGAAGVSVLGEAGGAPIVIRGEGAGPEEVVLDGEFWRSAGLLLSESHNIRIENLTVQHYSDAGISTLLGSKITLDGIVARSNGRCSVNKDSEGEGFGVNLVGTREISVTGSLFEDNGPLLAPVLCGLLLGTAINTFDVSGRIANNIIRHGRGGAVLVEDAGGPVVVEDNLAVQNFLLALKNYWDAGVWVDGSDDVSILNNTFRDNYGGVGIFVSDEEKVYPGAGKGISVKGNTISGHLAGVLVWGYETCPPPSDVILGYASLEADNTLEGNAFEGTDHPVWCSTTWAFGAAP